MVRRQLGTEDIPRTNPAEIYNSYKDQFADSKVSRISIFTIITIILFGESATKFIDPLI